METALELTNNSAIIIPVDSAGMPLSGGNLVIPDPDTAIYIAPIEVTETTIYIKEENGEVIQLDESTQRWIKIG